MMMMMMVMMRNNVTVVDRGGARRRVRRRVVRTPLSHTDVYTDHLGAVEPRYQVDLRVDVPTLSDAHRGAGLVRLRAWSTRYDESSTDDAPQDRQQGSVCADAA